MRVNSAMREEPPRVQRRVNDQAISLAREWRMLGRAATVVALFTSPALFALLYATYDWPLGWALWARRGRRDLPRRRRRDRPQLIPSPALYGAEADAQEQDVVSRRRLWYWRHKFKVWFWLGLIL